MTSFTGSPTFGRQDGGDPGPPTSSRQATRQGQGGPSLPSFDEMYRAVAGRDESFAGVFVVAVKTTGIFCRPGCPARVPLARNVEFFATPGDALHAGYRP